MGEEYSEQLVSCYDSSISIRAIKHRMCRNSPAHSPNSISFKDTYLHALTLFKAKLSPSFCDSNIEKSVTTAQLDCDV